MFISALVNSNTRTHSSVQLAFNVADAVPLSESARRDVSQKMPTSAIAPVMKKKSALLRAYSLRVSGRNFGTGIGTDQPINLPAFGWTMTAGVMGTSGV